MDKKDSRHPGDLSSHAAKRRRVEAASQILSKPFRSPFKSAAKPDRDHECSAPVDFAGSLVGSVEKQQTRSLANRRIQPVPSIAQMPKLRGRIRADLSKEPALYPILKEERQLEQELKELKSELDTIEQARKIETKEEDEELVSLIAKWKGAARAAAEEVFGKVSDRVNRYQFCWQR
ncbi:hypothetical protein FGG08_002988 [Glutinoglossum americanum]|uniref:Uncharacterized protein n=1 Tax=Glutinoglossum americanum TaxID=1670608 RepID=A0A9P8I5B7_9PEZI|nr:hypothetical protein FGG08_002988 [Glutinoglossum americanum]